MVLALALGLRLAHVAASSGDVLFEHPALDEERYVAEARRLAAGQSFETRAFWQPPGIIFALAAVLRVAGNSLVWPHVVQAVVGTLACVLVFALGRRVFDVRVGLVAALFTALHGGLIFSSGELLPATWAGAFDLLGLLLLLDAKDSPRHAMGAGLALGVSAVFTPVILPFVGVSALWLLRKGTDRATVLRFVGAVLLPILPVTLRNYAQSDELVLVSTNGGLNLFIGNNPHYFETWNTRPGIHWVELTEMPLRAAGISRPGASSAWFTKQALGFIAAHPIDALLLYLRKLALFFHAAEIPRDSDLYLARHDSWVLRLLTSPRPLWLPGSLLVPFALVGIFTEGRKRERLPVWFVAAQAGAIALFFVSGRYRVPVTPVLAMYAAAGLLSLRAAPRRLGLVAVLALLTVVPLREATTTFAAEPELFRGLALRRLGDTAGATRALARATEADPNDPRGWFELAGMLDLLRHPEAAATAWSKAASCDPTDLRPRRLAATALLRADDRAGAMASYRANVAANPSRTAFDRMQLAALHADVGEGEAMLREVAAAFAVDPRWVRMTAKDFAAAYRGKLLDPTVWERFDALVR